MRTSIDEAVMLKGGTSTLAPVAKLTGRFARTVRFVWNRSRKGSITTADRGLFFLFNADALLFCLNVRVSSILQFRRVCLCYFAHIFRMCSSQFSPSIAWNAQWCANHMFLVILYRILIEKPHAAVEVDLRNPFRLFSPNAPWSPRTHFFFSANSSSRFFFDMD